MPRGWRLWEGWCEYANWDQAQVECLVSMPISQWPGLEERTPSPTASLLLAIPMHEGSFYRTWPCSAQLSRLLWYFTLQYSSITRNLPRNLLLVASQEVIALGQALVSIICCEPIPGRARPCRVYTIQCPLFAIIIGTISGSLYFGEKYGKLASIQEPQTRVSPQNVSMASLVIF